MVALLLLSLLCLAMPGDASISSKAMRLVCVESYIGLDYCPSDNSNYYNGFTGYEPEVRRVCR